MLLKDVPWNNNPASYTRNQRVALIYQPELEISIFHRSAGHYRIVVDRKVGTEDWRIELNKDDLDAVELQALLILYLQG